MSSARSLLTITVSPFSQLGGGALAPDRLGEHLARHRLALLEHEVGEDEPRLASGEALLVHGDAVRLEHEPPAERDPDRDGR